MTYQFAVSPDFNAREIPSWYIFNTRLQQLIGQKLHLELYESFGALATAMREERVDLIYANAFDASYLVREKGFHAVAQAVDNPDEALVVAAADSPYHSISDLQPNLQIAATEAPDIEMIGRILLEPADLSRDNTSITYARNYVLVAKALLTGSAEVGFFLKRSYHQLSAAITKGLRVLTGSHIYVIRHVLLVGPRLEDSRFELLGCLGALNDDPKDKSLLKELGMASGWEEMTQDEVELMIDLMDTLVH